MSELFRKPSLSPSKPSIVAMVDYNNGNPIATCNYKGQLFFKSPLKCRLAKKPVDGTEKEISKWEERILTAATRAVRKCFESGIYQDVEVRITNFK